MKPNGTRAVKLMQLKWAFLGGFDITTKIKIDITQRRIEKKETVFDAVCFP